jgi:hypothetical protein
MAVVVAVERKTLLHITEAMAVAVAVVLEIQVVLVELEIHQVRLHHREVMERLEQARL